DGGLVEGSWTEGYFSTGQTACGDLIGESLDNISLFHFMHGYHNHFIYEDSLGDQLVAMRVCKRKIENATRRLSSLDPSKVESYIKISYTITDFGRLVLETLHQVYSDKIDKERLVKEGMDIQPVHSAL
ncbi:hypothetical protein NJF44_15525, partial [Pseudomonas guariconensis]